MKALVEFLHNRYPNYVGGVPASKWDEGWVRLQNLFVEVYGVPYEYLTLR